MDRRTILPKNIRASCFRSKTCPPPAIQSLGELHGRRFDLILARWPIPLSRDEVVSDLNVETLVDDPLIVAAGMHTRWAHRRKIDLAETRRRALDPRTASQLWNYEWVAQAFEARGLGSPKVTLITFNAHLNAHFLKTGRFSHDLSPFVGASQRVQSLAGRAAASAMAALTRHSEGSNPEPGGRNASSKCSRGRRWGY